MPKYEDVQGLGIGEYTGNIGEHICWIDGGEAHCDIWVGLK